MKRAVLTVSFLISGAASLKVNAQVLPPPILPKPASTPTLAPSEPPTQPGFSPPPIAPSPPADFPGEDTITVHRFEYQGNTVFSNQELDQITAPYVNRKITFRELLKARSAITRHYVERGYVTSAAYLPLQGNEAITDGGTVTIGIVEGTLERIDFTGEARLGNYVKARLAKAASPVVNSEKLIEALRILRVSPLIRSISANLSSGSQLGLNVLSVSVEATPTVTATLELNNQRSPGVGSFERGIEFRNANLLGLGDALQIGYANTDGSHQVDLDYRVPISASDATLSFRFSNLSSRIVEPPFEVLDIRSNSRIFEVTYRQPLIRSATEQVFQEWAIGVTGTRLEGEASLLGIPFPLSPGADAEGRTRLSVVRLFQEYIRRGAQQTFLVRSQVSVGAGGRSASNPFVVWRGQAAWLQKLGTRSYLLMRSDLQLADRSLISLEQFTIGGSTTIRGYRQDALLGDSGVLGSIEWHYPVFSNSTMELQVIPFLDGGAVWGRMSPNKALASTGLGLQWMWGAFVLHLSYGIPLIAVDKVGNSLQEDGWSGSLRYTFSF